VASRDRTHWENRRRVTDWVPASVTVFGGHVIRRTRWVRTWDGWEQEDEVLEHPETVYPTEAAAEAAIDRGISNHNAPPAPANGAPGAETGV
jgi:hypothetical protein